MNTLRVATVFTPVLELTPELRVHSVFTSGFNLSNGSRTLIWVAPLVDAAYPASLGLALERNRWLNLGIGAGVWAGEPVRVVHERSTVLRFVGGLTLLIDDDTRISSTRIPTGEVLSRPGYSTQIREAIVADHRPQPDAYDGVVASIEDHLSLALVALGDSDADAGAAHLRQIIGLGFGLTPTADDAVIGALGYTCMFDAALFQRLGAAVAPLVDRTTAVSATYLTLAMQGHFSRPLTDTLRGYTGDAVPDGLAGLLAMGHSSGVDTARGVLIAADAPHTSSPQPPSI